MSLRRIFGWTIRRTNPPRYRAKRPRTVDFASARHLKTALGVDLISIATAALGVSMIGAVVGTTAGNTAVRRWVAVGIAALGLLIPLWLAGTPLLLTALCVHSTLFVFMRSVDLARDPRPRSAVWRIASVLSVVDLRELRAGRRRVDHEAFAAVLAYFGGVLAGICLVSMVAPSVAGTPGLALRWLGGAVLVYCAADAFACAVQLGAAALGMRLPPIHRVPIAARSVREFWSRRWNINVSRWIRRHVYEPLRAVAGVRLALMGGFVVSAAVHAWLVYVPLDAVAMVPMAAYFVIQGLIVLAEGRLRVRAWQSSTQRLWTIVAVAGPSPLFVEPFVRVVMN